MNTWIWRSNRNKWNYVKLSTFCKFGGFDLQLYYHRAPSQGFQKSKIIRYTAFFESAKHLLFGTISHIFQISSQKEDSCQAINFMFKANDTKTREVVKYVSSLQYRRWSKANRCRSGVFIVNFENILSSFVANSNISFQNCKLK